MLVEYVVCAGSHPRRNREPEGLGHHAVDDEFIACWLLHRKIPGPGALDDAIDEGGRPFRDGGEARSVRDQCAAAAPLSPRHDDRQFALEGEIAESTVDVVVYVPKDEDAAGARRCRSKHLLVVGHIGHADTSIEPE